MWMRTAARAQVTVPLVPPVPPARRKTLTAATDRFETQRVEFFERVRAAYLARARRPRTSSASW